MTAVRSDCCASSLVCSSQRRASTCALSQSRMLHALMPSLIVGVAIIFPLHSRFSCEIRALYSWRNGMAPASHAIVTPAHPALACRSACTHVAVRHVPIDAHTGGDHPRLLRLPRTWGPLRPWGRLCMRPLPMPAYVARWNTSATGETFINIRL
jgi:hypothetical protein